MISLISLNSDVVESDDDKKSMFELNFLISLISLNSEVIESNEDTNLMFELNFLNSLNSAVIENNNDNSSMVEINFSISLNFRFSDRGGISDYAEVMTKKEDHSFRLATTSDKIIFV